MLTAIKEPQNKVIMACVTLDGQRLNSKPISVSPVAVLGQVNFRCFTVFVD